MKDYQGNTMRRRVLVAAVGLASTIAGSAVMAQESESLRLEEVRVTASKRVQTIEEIPMAVSILSADDIRNRGLERFEDYLVSIPGVQFIPAGTVYTSLISIRGVADPGAEFGLTQAPVAVYLDEAPLTVSQGSLNLDYSLFGVEQVSVVKGPHSTLYGASSLGGTLKVETRKPSVTDGMFEAQLGYNSISGGDSGYTAAFTASTPLIDGKLGAEVTAYQIDRGGYIDDPSRGLEDINGSETTGGRLAFSWLPTENLSVDAKVYYQDYESDGLSFFNFSSGGLDSRPLDGPQTDGDEVLLGSLVINWNLGFAELVSATNAFERDNFLYRTGPFFGSPGGFTIDSTAEAFTQELRLVSNSEGALDWLVGLYYAAEDYTEVGAFEVGGFPFFSQDLTNDITPVAAFGEASWHLNDRLSLTAGVRVSRYEMDSEIISGGLTEIDFNETDVSPRVALNYEIGDGSSVYIQAARGFRLGQPNTPIPVPAPEFVDAFDSDYLWNYEIGTKTEWWDGRARLNGAIYYIDWSDLQTSLVDPTGTFSFVGNAGSAEITGFELEGAALLATGLTLEAGLSYTDAEFATDVPSQGIVSGDPLLGVPEWQFSAGLQYDFNVAGRDTFLRADYLFYDEYLAFDPFSFDPTSRIANGDYERINARVGMQFGDVQVALFGTNLSDERPRLSVAATFGEDATTLQPRTFGLTLNYRPQ
ncbi:MAG: TonB-dependent receptor [Haliea sp.]